jgi:hypothetical protein
MRGQFCDPVNKFENACVIEYLASRLHRSFGWSVGVETQGVNMNVLTNEAYERMLKSDAKYRLVIDMASLKAVYRGETKWLKSWYWAPMAELPAWPQTCSWNAPTSNW